MAERLSLPPKKKVKTSKELLKPPKGPGVPLINEVQPLKTYKIQKSEILSQVKSFLPTLAQANHNLTDKTNKDVYNIEQVTDDDHQHIEMDIAIIPYNSEDDRVSIDKESVKANIKFPIEELS